MEKYTIEDVRELRRIEAKEKALEYKQRMQRQRSENLVLDDVASIITAEFGQGTFAGVKLDDMSRRELYAVIKSLTPWYPNALRAKE